MKYAIVRMLPDDVTRWHTLADAYLERAATYKAKNTLRAVDRPSLKAFGVYAHDPALSDITPVLVDKWVSALKAKYTSNSVRTRVVVLRLVFKYAISEGMAERNPFAHVRLPKAKPAGRALTDLEIKIFLSNMPDVARRACLLSLHTGMRRGEVCSLEWSQVTHSAIVIPQEKSKSKRERTIAICYQTLYALGKPGEGNIFGMSVNTLNRHVTAAWKKAGLGQIRFHDLRHTAATRFMESSDDIYAMMDAFGWANTSSALPYQKMTKTRKERMLGIHYDI